MSKLFVISKKSKHYTKLGALLYINSSVTTAKKPVAKKPVYTQKAG